MDFEALLCSVPGPHSIGMLFPFTQREIIETEGEGKKREERLEGEVRSVPGILWKAGSPLRAWITSQPREQGLGGCHPTGQWSGKGRGLESFVLGFQAASLAWERGSLGMRGVRWDLKAGKAGEVGNWGAWRRLRVPVRASGAY